MGEPKIWGKSRILVLSVVLALHLAVLALLVAASRTLIVGVPADRPIEVVLLPPPTLPKVRAERIRPRPIGAHIAIGLEPPSLGSARQPGSSSGSDGRGTAVNWAAEAHRALRAFEIRRDQPPNPALSVSSPLEEWWPREHHAGDRFKTDSGDWIVWINADCYQIAGWHSSSPVLGAGPSRTICPAKSGAPRSD